MFARHFHDPLSAFADAVADRAPAAATTVYPLTALCRPGPLDDVLDRFAASASASDRRATASQWSKYFFSRWIIAASVIQISENRAMAWAPDDLRVAFDADGVAQTFAAGAEPLDAARAGDDVRGLIDVLAPVVDALCGRCRLAPRVFWSNAAVYYDYVLDTLEAQQRLPEARLAASRAVMDTRILADGRRNPFYRPYRGVAAGTINGNGKPAERCRRLCCMRDLDARWSLCPTCPRAMSVSTPVRRAG